MYNSLRNNLQNCAANLNWKSFVVFGLKSWPLIEIVVLSIGLKFDFWNVKMFVSDDALSGWS